MLDRLARRLVDPVLNLAGRRLAARGLKAEAVTLAGLALGLAAAALVALGAPRVALVPLLLSRLADGLDGAVARAGKPAAFGGLMDIVADFLVYGAVPFGFVLADPANGTAGAFLLLSFYVNGASFLGVAILAGRRGIEAPTTKGFHFSAGLLEGTETIAFLAALCLWPALFPPLAWGFGALCFVTAGLRMRAARERFGAAE